MEIKKNIQSLVRRLPFGASAVSKTARPRLACEYKKSKLVFTEISMDAQGVTLSRYLELPSPRSPEEAATSLAPEIEKAGFYGKKVRLSVKGQGVVVRFIDFPRMKKSEIHSSLAYEVEKYIPYKASEVLIDFHLLNHEEGDASNKDTLKMILVVVKKEDVYNMIQNLQIAGLEVELVDINAFAFMNALEFFYAEEMKKCVGILDIGSNISTIAIANEGRPQFIRDIFFGENDFFKKLMHATELDRNVLVEKLRSKDVEDSSFEDSVKGAVSNLLADLKVSVEYYLDQIAGASPIDAIYIGGSGANYPFVVKTLTGLLDFPVLLPDLKSRLSIHDTVDRQFLETSQGHLPVTLGLNLRDV